MTDEEIFNDPEFQESLEQLRKGELEPARTAEEEAEEILRQAMTQVDMDGEDCPMGDACAIHHRNDEETLDDDEEFGRLITYVGDYMVVTSDNPDLEDPRVMLRILLGLYNADNAPALYDTTVLKVGEGAMADLRALSREDQKRSIRFVQQHNEWANFKAAHEAVVQGVRDGLINLDTPVCEQEEEK